MKQYDNIVIEMKDGHPSCEKKMLEGKLEESEVLFKSLFTLVGTDSCEMIPEVCLYSDKLSKHKSYTTVARVEAVNDACVNLEVGDIVLTDAHFESYFIQKMEQKRKSMFIKLSNDIDYVNAVFLPLICSAVSLCNDIEMYECEKIAIAGCSLFGAVLLKIMKQRNMHPILITEAQDLKKENLLKYGAESVICKEELSEEMINSFDLFIALSSSEFAEDVSRVIQQTNSSVEIYECEDVTKTCLNRDAREEVLQQLMDEELVVKDLIAQHVHAEHILYTLELLSKDMFFNMALVYDW